MFGVKNKKVEDSQNLLTIKQASEWATNFTGKTVLPSNIAYLINYGRIAKFGENGNTLIDIKELENYYLKNKQREFDWKEKLGENLNWLLSFDKKTESETTKHVHRLHPYKGKFIPQLVEYFLDDHIDEFKTQVFFEKDDVVLDPFCGSGTTLVQANELGINAIGIDISKFNTVISNVKIQDVNLYDLVVQTKRISSDLKNFTIEAKHIDFEDKLADFLNQYNKKFYPSPEYKIKVRTKEINEKEYQQTHEPIVLEKFNELIEEFNLKIQQGSQDTFLDKWFIAPVREEIDFVAGLINQVENEQVRRILTVILSRTVRSCRATTHADLATLAEPVTTTYYCKKHGKICKPLFSIVSWWERYSKDTIERLDEFKNFRTNTQQICLNGNSETLDIFAELEKENPEFADLARNKKIKGIFSSPPYVGLIDYHEQHAYAYDLFGFDRQDDQEIGSMKKRQSKQAQADYAKGIANVLNNCKKFLAQDFDIFLVANDKYNLYPQIAKTAEMQIVNQYVRPVLNRTEKDKQAYSEIIFHLKRK